MAGVMDGIFITLAESVLKWKGETLSVGKAGDILGQKGFPAPLRSDLPEPKSVHDTPAEVHLGILSDSRKVESQTYRVTFSKRKKLQGWKRREQEHQNIFLQMRVEL